MYLKMREDIRRGGVNKEISTLDDTLKLLNLGIIKYTHRDPLAKIYVSNVFIEGGRKKFHNVILRNDDL